MFTISIVSSVFLRVKLTNGLNRLTTVNKRMNATKSDVNVVLGLMLSELHLVCYWMAIPVRILTKKCMKMWKVVASSDNYAQGWLDFLRRDGATAA